MCAVVIVTGIIHGSHPHLRGGGGGGGGVGLT